MCTAGKKVEVPREPDPGWHVFATSSILGKLESIGPGGVCHMGNVQRQDGKYGQRNWEHKGLLFRKGAILVMLTHTCQAFEDICRGRKKSWIAAWRWAAWLPALGLRQCVISPVFLGALLTPDCSFSSHSSALPFIEMLSKEAAGLMSQDLYALLRRREREENLLNSLTKFLPWRFDLVLTY